MTEKAIVTFTVIGIEPVRGHGALLALAAVEMEVEGIVLQLDGVGVVRTGDGKLRARAPQFRGGDGTWRSALGMPEALTQAMGESVLEIFLKPEAAHG